MINVLLNVKKTIKQFKLYMYITKKEVMFVDKPTGDSLINQMTYLYTCMYMHVSYILRSLKLKTKAQSNN